jgi:hypothetical protein
VLNSLIFPAHEQHHNNSFLCAALVMGQSNMAAGATIGSNHNSRSPDGELIAGRGFWPGLCVSLKHNSKFASFLILAKGDYPAELNIPVPFSLVSNDVSRDELIVMPAFWFLHNMYALARNSWKYTDRDKRTDRTQLLEYDFLAPDSVNEMIISLDHFRRFTAKAYTAKFEIGEQYTDEQLLGLGKKILEGSKSFVDDLEIFAENFEHSKRRVRMIKIFQAYHLFRELISYYSVKMLIETVRANKIKSLDDLKEHAPARLASSSWVNMGGQLVQEANLQKMIQRIHAGKIRDWDQVHHFYQEQAESYSRDKWVNSLSALKEVHGLDIRKVQPAQLKILLQQSISTREWMTKGIYESRAKDYANPFRRMVYESYQEMNHVTGSLEENTFIKQEIDALESFKKEIRDLSRKFKL